MTQPLEAVERSLARPAYAWEQPLQEAMERIIPENDVVHGFVHAQAVVDSVYGLQFEPEFRLFPPDGEVLIAGAYVHDIGYAYHGPFSKDTFEHIAYGEGMARDILTSINGFNPQKIEAVIYLLRNHDNAKFSVPNHHLAGVPRFTPADVEKREQTDDPSLRTALVILKEADSREYTDLWGTQRALKYGQDRGFPLVVDGESPSPHHSLNRATLSNILLFPHLAWLNATTEKGKDAASRGYLAAEQWVFEYCREHGFLYVPDRTMEEVLWALNAHPELVPEHLLTHILYEQRQAYCF